MHVHHQALYCKADILTINVLVGYPAGTLCHPPSIWLLKKNNPPNWWPLSPTCSLHDTAYCCFFPFRVTAYSILKFDPFGKHNEKRMRSWQEENSQLASRFGALPATTEPIIVAMKSVGKMVRHFGFECDGPSHTK